MRNPRAFSLEFKRQAMEELVNGEAALPSYAAAMTSSQACSITGRDNTAGASSITSLLRKGL